MQLNLIKKVFLSKNSLNPILFLIKRVKYAACFFRDILTTHGSEHSKKTRSWMKKMSLVSFDDNKI